MKAIKVVFGLLMVLVVIGGSVVVAQEVDPPREPLSPELVIPEVPQDSTYRTRPGVEINQLTPEEISQAEAAKQLEMAQSGLRSDLPFMEEQQPPVSSQFEIPEGTSDEASAFEETTRPAVPEVPIFKEGSPDEIDGLATRTVYPQSGTIIIANSLDHEWWPAVAHGGNYYMVVYSLNGNIIAKVYSDSGTLQYTHTVVDLPNNCSYPTITYEASSGLFVVAFEYAWTSTDTDIYTQAVSPTTGKKGTYVGVANTTLNEWNPSVACNATNGSCLVAYTHNQTEMIRGRYFTLTSSGITGSSASTYDLTNDTPVWFPHLAWGKGTGNFLLTYNWDDGTGEIFPMYTHVYDTLVAGAKYLHGNAYVVRSEYFATHHNKYNFSVDFDPCTQHYIVAFTYEYSPSDQDIYAVAKHATFATGQPPFSVAASSDNETKPMTSFVTDDHLTAACGRMDKLVVLYDNDTAGIKAADLRGNNSTSAPRYTRDGIGIQLVVYANSASTYHTNNTAIAGGSQGAKLFLAFERVWEPAFGGDPDILGKLVEVRERTYLPLLVR